MPHIIPYDASDIGSFLIGARRTILYMHGYYEQGDVFASGK